MKTQDISKNGYIVSDAVLADLALRYAEGIELTEGTRATYLQILVAHSKQELGEPKRYSREMALRAIENTHGRLYGVILYAVVTPEIAANDELPAEESRRRAKERNRRTTFARTSKSTLAAWVRNGGKLTTLDPATTTKDALRVQRTLSPEERMQVAEERLIELLKALDESERRAAFEELSAHVQVALGFTKPLTRTPRKVGSVTLHPH